MNSDSARAMAFGIFFLIAIPITIIDIRRQRIPDVLVFAGMGALLVWYAFAMRTFLVPGASAASIAALLFYAIRHVTGGMGFGDVKYAALIGLLCGIRALPIALLGASCSGLLYAAYAVWIRGRSMKERIPFAPFLTLGGLSVGLHELSLFLFQGGRL